ncbi:MAG: hypothetical protein EP305_10485 [Bacteroidetes bacterium]|nr:MAG: hypothetical protein EP305_10485 [Bacteroidota bacterium]
METNGLDYSPLTSMNKSTLKKQLRAPFIFTLSLFVMISLVNLAFHFMDVLTGVEVVERPPVSRLFIIEGFAFLIAFFSFFFMTRNVRRDLSSGKKQNEKRKIVRKYVRKENGLLIYQLLLENKRNIDVDQFLYSKLTEGDVVNVSFAPNSNLTFDVDIA